MEDLASELRKVPLLTEMSDEDINKLINNGNIHHKHHRRGEVIIKLGTLGDHFYIVLSGKLRALAKLQEKEVPYYHPQWDFCGEVALLKGTLRQATVDVFEDADLALFDKTAFNLLITRYPKIKAYLEKRAARFEKPLPRDFHGKDWDEDTVIFQGRHILALAERMFFPVLIIVLLFVIEYVMEFLLGISISIAILLSIPLIIFTVLLGIYFYVDWANDHFIVTNKRVIHIEHILFYGESRNEALLEHVQDVKLDKPNVSYKLFGLHDVIVRTAGAGSLTFTKMAHGERIQQVIFAEVDKAKLQSAVTEKERILQELRYQLGQEKREETLPMELAPTEKRLTKTLPALLDYFIPRLRIVEQDRIIWRKHWVILIQRTWLQFSVFLVACCLFAASLLSYFPFNSRQGLAIPLMFGLFVTTFSWLLWYYEDWRNDLYIATQETLIDIKITPFGLFGESRRDGTFDAVQDINYEIPSLVTQLINLGNVNIQMIGQTESFKFHQVFNPRGVQEEIFDRVSKSNERRRWEEQSRELKNLAVWFGQYDEMLKKPQQEKREES
jgi:hypothetical protein